MSTKQDRYLIYKKCFDKLPVTQGGLARLMNLGEEPDPVAARSIRSKIREKPRGTEGCWITKQEALAIQLLALLHEQGYDIKNLEFDKKGLLTAI